MASIALSADSFPALERPAPVIVDQCPPSTADHPDAVPVSINFSFKLEFDLPTLIEIVAGLHAIHGFRNYRKRALVNAIREHVITFGRANLAGWQHGLPEDRQRTLREQAFTTVVFALRSDVFPGIAVGEVKGYRQRLDEWRQSLDREQLRRYTSGKLKAFSEPGRCRRS
ncbi:hypothetical protein [Nocardia sp. NPDC052566]|uniref:hypothetical protein n=1 Tax=Nocardia sp. NPDC052566 TaxID=3364330 RepID=UPI0037CA8615